MAIKVYILVVTTIVSAMIVENGMEILAKTESPPPPEVLDEYCDVPFTSLNACLPACVGTSPPPPNSTCCILLSHAANLHCLCRAIRVGIPGQGPHGEPLNYQAVNHLPKKCDMNVPKNFTCESDGTPV